MKKILTFIPLGIGISATIIYVINIIRFRVINNAATLMQILSNLKIYLYVAIGGFITYFFIKVLISLNDKHKFIEVVEEDDEFEGEPKVTKSQDNYNYGAAQNMVYNQPNPVNYGYSEPYNYNPNMPNMYDASNFNAGSSPSFNASENINNNQMQGNSSMAYESVPDKEVVTSKDKYCFKCGSKVSDEDLYCRACGTYQKKDKQKLSPLLRKVINVLEIVILLLVIYFSLNMLFDYKESKDPNFTSPFKISMTK